MLIEIPAEQLSLALDTCAREVLESSDITAPPVDAIALARRLDLQVACDRTMDVRARFVRLPAPGQGAIFLAEDERPERLQWATVHEVGEFLAHRVVKMLSVDLADLPEGGREWIANRLAGCLLLPRQWFAVDGRSTEWDLLELKSIYRTASHEMIARRMIEMNPPVIISLFDQGELVWRKSNALRPPPLVQPERDTWQVVHECNKPARHETVALPPGIYDIRCWPVHEPGWRREIIRTELDQW